MGPGSTLGGAAAIAAAAALLVGVGALASGKDPWRPWLVVLFGINAGIGHVSKATLRGIRTIDVVLLLLAGATYASFWPGPGADQTAWMVLAVGQPLAGIALLIATRQIGRSGLMGGALVLSVLMVLDGTWAATGWLGVGASVFLLIGDFGTTGRASGTLAAALAVGYAALVPWLVWIGVLLLA